jgi:hypothetical protein
MKETYKAKGTNNRYELIYKDCDDEDVDHPCVVLKSVTSNTYHVHSMQDFEENFVRLGHGKN